MAELKKCPFCGGEAEHEIFNDGFFTFGRVECKQCKAMLTTPPVNTINAWNNRPAEAEIRAKAIDEFAEKLKDFIAKQVEDAESSNDLCTEIFQSEIDEIADELKEET